MKLTPTIAALAVAGLTVAGAVVAAPGPTLTDDVRGDQQIAAAASSQLGGVRREVAVLYLDGNGSRQALFNTTATTQFQAGSLTKLFTTQLYINALERGEVRRTQKLGSLLPLGDAPVADVTLQELAEHKSGLGLWGADSDNPVRELWQDHVVGKEVGQGASYAELLDRARRDPLDTRGRFEYSNIGIALLGHALSAAADVPFDQLLSSRVLQPLEMTNTWLPNANSLNPPRGLTDGGAPAAVWRAGAYAPAGGAVTTLVDLGRFARYVANTRPPRNQGDVDDGFLVTNVDGRPILGKTGTVTGFSTAMLVDRRRKAAAIVLSDSDEPVMDAAKAVLREGLQ
ncbi:beta-lactamase family protein [Corynebacterium sp. TAE3-ERU12]|uniref:serine hydrolase domain-containing protein n=1 Tax=Corynebacterium sp. TAE3-ERU12 TaxID=2849491 RepID=UPI001C46792A|nr:serine hydrolase domain-containing protein [Corynebacterium sp. TAE3-ERU12]MBV7295637.1 beta-lactamase family protein [Corynebacterium sp. TAE3-ERU12]